MFGGTDPFLGFWWDFDGVEWKSIGFSYSHVWWHWPIFGILVVFWWGYSCVLIMFYWQPSRNVMGFLWEIIREPKKHAHHHWNPTRYGQKPIWHPHQHHINPRQHLESFYLDCQGFDWDFPWFYLGFPGVFQGLSGNKLGFHWETCGPRKIKKYHNRSVWQALLWEMDVKCEQTRQWTTCWRYEARRFKSLDLQDRRARTLLVSDVSSDKGATCPDPEYECLGISKWREHSVERIGCTDIMCVHIY